MLEKLFIQNLGPSPVMELNLAQRLNLITGDNGLGKTFLLDLAWWALTRTWADDKVIHPGFGIQDSSIQYSVIGKTGPVQTSKFTYSKENESWSAPAQGRPPITGLVIYARLDGGFSVKDPERNYWRDKDESTNKPLPRPEAFQFNKKQVWEGLKDESDKVLCRGLVEDWETWRLKGNGAFEMLRQVLQSLSPGGKEHPLTPGTSTRVPGYGAQDIPTLVMPYGEVPIHQASAGVRRIISLAYLIVWAWTEHKIEAQNRGNEASKKIVLLWDELEAHLHPQWQRTILPAVIEVLQRLLKEADGTDLQLIATTHAPLILASMEPHWEEDQDRLFNLELSADGKQVEVEEVPWAKFGDASGWLTSPAFDMKSGYSREAEEAMQAADDLMVGITDDLPEGMNDVASIHAALQRTLDGGDPFWPMWLPFYRQQTKASR
jgi:hypothetical protein